MGHLGPVGGISVVNKATCVDVTSDDMIDSASKEMINKADAVGSDGGETQRQSPVSYLTRTVEVGAVLGGGGAEVKVEELFMIPGEYKESDYYY